MALKDDFNSGLSEIRKLLPNNATIITNFDEKYVVSCTTSKISEEILRGNNKLNRNSLKIKFLISDLLDAKESTTNDDSCPIKNFGDCNIVYRSINYSVIDEKQDGNFDTEVALYVSRVG